MSEKLHLHLKHARCLESASKTFANNRRCQDSMLFVKGQDHELSQFVTYLRNITMNSNLG